MILIKKINLRMCFLHNISRFKSFYVNTSDLNQVYLENSQINALESNVLLRNHENNIPKIRLLITQLQSETQDIKNKKDIQNQLVSEFKKLPNNTHPRVINYGSDSKEIMIHKSTKTIKNESVEFSKICKWHNILRMDHLGNFTGHKSYYLLGFLAELEQAIIEYAIKTLQENNFRLMSVPDILNSHVINGCGMQIDGERTQVYKIGTATCLSGTSEMALAGYFSNEIFDEKDLPLNVAAVSRCYRAETSSLQEEQGIYRVHHFTKVEMFSICSKNQSEHELEKFKNMEIKLFADLDLTFKVLDMPPPELGAPAYRKYDIDVWMPGRKMWGEISSCSDCTNYQAKRLGIRYRDNHGKLHYVHTVNGTAAAIPRLLIALLESNQKDDGTIQLPKALQQFLREGVFKNKTEFPELKLLKFLNSLN